MAADVRILIRAIDKASATLRHVGQSASGMSSELTTAALAGRPLGVALAGIGAAGAAVVGHTALLAARVETLGVVLNTVGENAGYTQEQLAAFEAGVKAMGITTQASRQGLALMVQAEIDLAHATDLARIAQDAAVFANINSSKAFAKMVRGIQQGRTIILRGMGLNVDFTAAYKRMADQLGTTSDALSTSEKMQARLNEVVRQGVLIENAYENAMGSVGKKLTSLPRLYEEAALAMGKHYLPVLERLVDAQEILLKSFLALDPEVQKMISYGIALGAAAAVVVGGLILLLPQILAIGAALGTVGVFVGEVVFSLGLLAAGAGVAGLGLAGFAAIALTVVAALAAVAAGIWAVVNINKELEGATKGTYEEYVEYMRVMGQGIPILSKTEWLAKRVREETDWMASSARKATPEFYELAASEQVAAAATWDFWAAAMALEQDIPFDPGTFIDHLNETRIAVVEFKGEMGDWLTLMPAGPVSSLFPRLLSQGLEEAREAAAGLRVRLVELAPVVKDIGSVFETTALNAYKMAVAAGLQGEAAIQLAIDLGLVTQAEVDLMTMQRDRAQAMADGSMTNAEYARTIREIATASIVLDRDARMAKDGLEIARGGMVRAYEAAGVLGDKVHRASDQLRKMPKKIDVDINWTHRIHGKRPDTSPGGEQEYAQGTNYVPQTGMALLHKGEMVVPAGEVATLKDRMRRNTGRMAGMREHLSLSGEATQADGPGVVIHNHFGQDSVRSEQDILDLAGEIERTLALRGLRRAL